MNNQLNFIWAEDRGGGIGYRGQMPWHLAADLKHFKRVTMGHPVIMGATTMKSIGRPLPGRTNLVITHHDDLGAEWTRLPNLDAVNAWLAAHPQSQPFVIGGAAIYRQLLPKAGQLYRTVIEATYRTDKKMPPIDYDQWQLVNEQTLAATDNHPAARFEQWRRR